MTDFRLRNGPGLRTILAPTDFSPHARCGLRAACGLAETFGASLHLLHVLSEVVPLAPDPMVAAVPPPEYYAESERASYGALSKALDPSWGRPPTVVTRVRWGAPVDAILEYARTAPADLLVIATHGRTGLSHALLGSVAERIVRESPCPVLTIRDRS